MELLAIITILAILIVLLSGVLTKLPGAADRVRCTQNLKNIHVALSAYLDEKGHWPKEPSMSSKDPEKQTAEQLHAQDARERKEVEDFWLDALKSYGISEAIWQCPGITRLGKLQVNGYVSRLHYQITPFDDKRGTPYRWPKQPWVVEIGNAHGRGPLLILPDGSVHDWDPYVESFGR